MKYLWEFKLKELLNKRGVSQKELAERTGLREATISEMVNDTRSVFNKKHIVQVMEALNVTSLNDLIELHVYDDDGTKFEEKKNTRNEYVTFDKDKMNKKVEDTKLTVDKNKDDNINEEKKSI